jgi:hypothetical protein
VVALEKELPQGSGFTSTTPAISTASSATVVNLCIASVVETLKNRICSTIPAIPVMSCITSKRKKRGNNGEQNGDDHVHDHRNKGKNAIIIPITERLLVKSTPLFGIFTLTECSLKRSGDPHFADPVDGVKDYFLVSFRIAAWAELRTSEKGSSSRDVSGWIAL